MRGRLSCSVAVWGERTRFDLRLCSGDAFSGLAHIHETSIHGGVKPSNMLLCRGGAGPGGEVLKLCDAGLGEAARVLSPGGESASEWDAPEVHATGTTRAADVWSCAAVLSRFASNSGLPRTFLGMLQASARSRTRLGAGGGGSRARAEVHVQLADGQADRRRGRRVHARRRRRRPRCHECAPLFCACGCTCSPPTTPCAVFPAHHPLCRVPRPPPPVPQTLC